MSLEVASGGKFFVKSDTYPHVERVRQYRTRISQWGLDKNIKPQEMKAIVKKRLQRKLVESDKGELIFTVRGSTVEPKKIDRWIKRNEIPESVLYAPSPAACKRASCWYFPVQES